MLARTLSTQRAMCSRALILPRVSRGKCLIWRSMGKFLMRLTGLFTGFNRTIGSLLRMRAIFISMEVCPCVTLRSLRSDGSISAFRIHNGHVDYQQKYVKTDRFMVETKYRRNLFGKYRNPFTDDPVVQGVIRTASNTNIIFHRGVLLATKEDGPPFAMDPTTLETIGKWDFDGQIKTPTFTAHPKFDPDTGEMICFGYEAGGNGQDASRDIVVYTIDKDGKKTEEAWYKSPYCGMIHDCALTKNWLILPLTPIECKLDRLKRGGKSLGMESETASILWCRSSSGWET